MFLLSSLETSCFACNTIIAEGVHNGVTPDNLGFTRSLVYSIQKLVQLEIDIERLYTEQSNQMFKLIALKW
jgi:hypothetical protein